MALKPPDPPKGGDFNIRLYGPDYEDLEFIAKVHGLSGTRLGRALRHAVVGYAKYLRAQNPSPKHNDETAEDLGLSPAKTPTPIETSKSPIDWSKGDPVPEMGLEMGILQERPKPIQSLIDAAMRPMSTQLPKPLTQTPNLKVVVTNLTPSNVEMLKKIYILDNYYHELGSKNDRDASTQWMKTLLAGHSIPTRTRALAIIEAHMKDMMSHPDWHERWAIPNPRWPQADELVQANPLKAHEI